MGPEMPYLRIWVGNATGGADLAVIGGELAMSMLGMGNETLFAPYGILSGAEQVIRFNSI